MKYICSLIVVSDIKRSRYLYETILEQKVKDDFGENVSFHGGFAIHEKTHFQKLLNNNLVISKSNSSELYFEEEKIEKIVAKIKKENLEFVHEIIEQPWKQKVVRFYDYDKNLIEIGEPLEYTAYRLYQQDYAIDEICRITYLNETSVKSALKQYSQGV